MNTLNSLAAKPAGNHPSINPYRPSFSKPLYSLSFRITPPSSHHISHSAMKASSQNPNPKQPNKSRNFFKLQICSEIPNSTPSKSNLITTITAAAIFLSGFHFSHRPSIAAPISTPPAVEATTRESVSAEEKEKLVEKVSSPNTNGIDELKNSIEIKIKSKKIPEAIEILNKLMELEPDEIDWRLLRAHLYAHNGEFQLARKVFHEMLNKNPNCLEACQGLVNVDSQEESNGELKKTEKRVLEAIRLSKENTENTNLKDFKLLLAQIHVLEGKYDVALNYYKELEKEEPGDFRVYLCQGLVYILLKRENEAEISFEKYKKLVPEGHLYESYFGDDSLNAAKIYAQKVENERS